MENKQNLKKTENNSESVGETETQKLHRCTTCGVWIHEDGVLTRMTDVAGVQFCGHDCERKYLIDIGEEDN